MNINQQTNQINKKIYKKAVIFGKAQKVFKYTKFFSSWASLVAAVSIIFIFLLESSMLQSKTGSTVFKHFFTVDCWQMLNNWICSYLQKTFSKWSVETFSLPFQHMQIRKFVITQTVLQMCLILKCHFVPSLLHFVYNIIF